MLTRGVNTIETSSRGRLFDAVAAIAGVRLEASYQGQGAMEMEALARRTALPVDERIRSISQMACWIFVRRFAA